MENKEPQTAEQAAQETLDIISKAKKNSKIILGLSLLVLCVIVAILIWFFVAKSGSAKADEAIARADVEQNDSIAMVKYQEAAEMGYKSGNRAKLEVAIRYYQEGKYQEALDYLKDASIDDKVVAAGALTLEGDCYVNLKEYDKALSAFDKAISKADKNPQIVPLVLVKEANVYKAQEKYADAAKALKTIIDEYPQFSQQNQYDVRKNYEMLNDMAKGE